MSKPIWTTHVDHLIAQARRDTNRKIAATLRAKAMKHKLFGLGVRAHLACNDSVFVQAQHDAH